MTVYTAYKGKNLLLTHPDYSSDPTESIYSPTFGFSSFAGSMRWMFADYPVFKVKNKYSYTDIQSYTDFNTLFDLCCGRWGSLWVPSWMNDLQLTQDVVAGDNHFHITDITYNTYYPATPGTGRYVLFYYTNNIYEVKKVTSVTGSSQLNVDAVFVQSFPKNKLKYVCFLYLVRFDIDEIEWTYVSPLQEPMVAIADNVEFIELPHEYASVP